MSTDPRIEWAREALEVDRTIGVPAGFDWFGTVFALLAAVEELEKDLGDARFNGQIHRADAREFAKARDGWHRRATEAEAVRDELRTRAVAAEAREYAEWVRRQRAERALSGAASKLSEAEGGHNQEKQRADQAEVEAAQLRSELAAQHSLAVSALAELGEIRDERDELLRRQADNQCPWTKLGKVTGGGAFYVAPLDATAVCCKCDTMNNEEGMQ